MPVKNKEIHLASRPVGVPAAKNFKLVQNEIGDPKDGEVLIRNIWMSVDPYMRGRMMDIESYVPPFQIDQPLEGGAVGQVVASKSSKLAKGDYVSNMLGWREYALANDGAVQKIQPAGMPLEAYLSVVGMPGMTAYVGLMKIAKLQDKENVFISAAAGAVGSVACQIAKAKGCYVVGTAGSDEKCKWLKDVAGVDVAINYKTCGDLSQAVVKAFPKGADVYFENVGGDHFEAAITAMNPFGRIAMCGMISQYNNTAPQPGPSNMIYIIGKSIKVEGFIVSNNLDIIQDFQKDMTAWISAGKIKWEQTVHEGIENAPGAFIKLFSGGNMGKMLVKLGADPAV